MEGEGNTAGRRWAERGVGRDVACEWMVAGAIHVLGQCMAAMGVEMMIGMGSHKDSLHGPCVGSVTLMVAYKLGKCEDKEKENGTGPGVVGWE
jgi:hypothetical protein